MEKCAAMVSHWPITPCFRTSLTSSSSSSAFHSVRPVTGRGPGGTTAGAGGAAVPVGAFQMETS